MAAKNATNATVTAVANKEGWGIFAVFSDKRANGKRRRKYVGLLLTEKMKDAIADGVKNELNNKGIAYICVGWKTGRKREGGHGVYDYFYVIENE